MEYGFDVTVCDEMGDPNQLATCGRKAVADKDVAIIGSFTITGDRIVPILENAKISWFGICCPVAPRELSSPITYSFGPGPAGIAGFGPKVAQLGCKTPSLMLVETPAKTLYTNIIATAIAAKKKVLFVSEKLAALEAWAGQGHTCRAFAGALRQWISIYS